MGNHTSELWAWEFLRRNQEYRKDWETALAKWNKRRNRGKSSWRQLVDQGYNAENERPERISFKNARSRWGLLEQNIVDPDIDIDKRNNEFNMPLFYEAGLLFHDNEFSILQVLGIEKSQVILLFDLNHRIKQQYDQNEAELLALQNEFLRGKRILDRKNTGKHDLWGKYIRILDAYEAKIKPSEIAPVIFPDLENDYPGFKGTRRVSSYFNSAKELVDGEYFKILQETSIKKQIKNK